MSNSVDVQCIYTPQIHIINTSFHKQQPASKLVNRYLSTAAQYLHRTKSFHVPASPNQNHHIRLHLSSADTLTKSMHNLNPSMALESNNSPLNCNNNNNKTQGLVNTLRRSLRKNRERFYNKRSSTMKSCQSLNTTEQQQEFQSKFSMTPTFNSRRQQREKNKNDSTPPLQPLAINGRNRILTNGPLAHQQVTSVLPPAASLQSLSPLTAPFSDQQQTSDQEEKEKLLNDIQQLKTELQKSKETIVRLQKSEEQMRERLAEQAQRQLEKGGKFEDLNQISRPTELIRSFNTLYSQARIDALDSLDNIREMSDAEDLKSKLLFSVVVLAFRHAQTHARDIRTKIKQILQLTNDKNSTMLEETIEKYLQTTILKYDIEKIAFEVENQLWATLYDYPSLKNCNELHKYINSACRTAWGLVNQTPAYYIEFQTIKYDKQIHERFHTSDNESDVIIEYIWPCLFDGRDRTCVAKGVVITDENYLTRKTTNPSSS